MIVDYNALLDVDIQVTRPVLVPQDYQIHARTYINAEFEGESNPITFKLEEKVTVSSSGGDTLIEVAMKQLAEHLWRRLKNALDTDQFIVPLYGESGDYIGFSTYYPERLTRFGPQQEGPRSDLNERLYRLFVKQIQELII